MHEYLQTIYLAILQGLTEFLPISSSGHLALWSHLVGSGENILALIIATHVGTLGAVVVYFRAQVGEILRAWLMHIKYGEASAQSRLAWAVVTATIIIAVAGLLFAKIIATNLHSPMVIATTTLTFGIVLWLADYFGTRAHGLDALNWRAVIIIGIAQVLSLIPGVSRSGITISAGLAVGLTRDAAARFSFLLAMPVIMLAGIWQAYELLSGDEIVDWLQLGIAAAVAFLVAWVCIHYFLAFIQKYSLLPFVIYRIMLGVILFAVFG